MEFQQTSRCPYWILKWLQKLRKRTCWRCPKWCFRPGTRYAEEKREDQMPSHSEGCLFARQFINGYSKLVVYVLTLPTAPPIFSNGILYTIVTRNPLTGIGCHVTVFFTIDQSMGILANFLTFLRNIVGILNIEKITIDVSSTELGAIQEVYPSANAQWCLFHVARAWTGKIRQLVKPGNTHRNNTIQNKIIADLEAMMWEHDRPVFTRKLTAFITEYSVYRDFLQCFKSRYVEDDAFLRLSAAWQPAIYTNMGDADALEQLIETARTGSAGRSVYVVSSFSTSGVSYDVVVDDFQMISCSCPDFRFNNIACKYMYLLKRDMSWLSVFEVSFDPTFSNIQQPSADSSSLPTSREQASPIAPTIYFERN
ncbi:hypothetical protein INT47_010374 [Mucor saturninus]|uniref:SWIM-type domain-containing protein n=1 Tax=Mucor saturninus TaxID=64648 RepID=A0A8H7UUW3_9FUNG|nr:hypothetical protein INT47_010374 [Mucor saturninus]